MMKMTTTRQPQDYGLDDSSDLEDSWAAESVMFDTSPTTSRMLNFLFNSFNAFHTCLSLSTFASQVWSETSFFLFFILQKV